MAREPCVRGEILSTVRKIASLEKVRKKMAGRLPSWSELEGKADELVLQETRKDKH